MIAAVLLAACGGGGDDSGAASTSPTTTPDTPPATTVEPAITGMDPLFPYQWHLANTGQDALSSIRPVAGIDLNLDALHASGIRGGGVRVAVIDSGLDIRHQDLAANMAPNGSINFLNGSNDPTPATPEPDHGTSVAGIVGARGWNGVGGRGVAPEATLHGFNVLAAQSEANYMAALGNAPQAAPVHVFNLSLGSEVTELEPLSTNDIDAMEKLMASTRSGLGGLYIKSAGNGFFYMENIDCTAALWQGVSCENAEFDSDNNLVGMTVVGAVSASGKRSLYSTHGASLWVSGLGGDQGIHLDQAPTALELFLQPGILTTDLSGCDKGYHRSIGTASNLLDLAGASPLDPTCDYTSTFHGTSAAAPTVAGVVALMLQVNPALTQREVEYLLATTARRIDYPGKPIQYEGLAVDDAWIVNSANRAFSNAYGFGLVDARAAVEAARVAKPMPAALRTNWLASQPAAPLPIPYRDGAGTVGVIPLTVTDALTVENVQVSFKTTHRDPSKLRVTLISPSGARSILLWPFTSLKPLTGTTAAGFSADLMRSNAFLDEKAQGTWHLEVIDVSAASGVSNAQFTDWSLRVAGQ